MNTKKTKRPLSVWIALVIFYLLTLLWATGLGAVSWNIFNFFSHTYSVLSALETHYLLPLELLLRSLALLLQIFNLWGLHQRKSFSRWISLTLSVLMSVLFLYLVFSSLEDDLETTYSMEFVGIIIGLFLATALILSPFLWTAISFAFLPSVKKYFSTPIVSYNEPPSPEQFFPSQN